MVKDLESLKCSHCGQTYRIGEFSGKKSMICNGCGLEAFPLIIRNISRRNTKEFCVILGFFAITALLGGLGGVMLMHGWSLWTTFAMIGGIVYFTGKIFTGKYKISEIGEYIAEEVTPKDHDIKHATIFEQLVADAIKELPQSLQDRLSNVSIVIEDKPTSYLLEKLKIMPNRTLLGLFQGVPLNKRSVWQSGTMPERITIFQKNIETICYSEEEIKKRITNVVRHELAHFVGFTEEEIRSLGY